MDESEKAMRIPQRYVITLRDSDNAMPKVERRVFRESLLDAVDSAIRLLRLQYRTAKPGQHYYDVWEVGVPRGRLSVSNITRGNLESTVDDYRAFLPPVQGG